MNALLSPFPRQTPNCQTVLTGQSTTAQAAKALALAGLLALPIAAPTAAAQNTAPANAATTPNANTPKASNYTAVGLFYFGRGDFVKAALAYEIAAERNPTNSEALLGLGRSQIRLGQAAKATQTLERLTTLDPSNISGYIAWSQAYSLAYKQSQANGNPNPKMLASAYTILQRAEEALGRLLPSDRNVQRSKVLNERGYLLRLEGRLPEAAEAFTKASQLNVGEGVILQNLAETQEAQGQMQQALDTMRRAVLAQPTDAAGRAYFARLLAETGDFALALPQAAKAVELAPNNAYVAAQQGAVAYLSYQPKLARTELARAKALAPQSFGPYHYFEGRLELDAANLATARTAFAKAAQQAPNAATYFYLGLSLERGNTGLPPQPQQARAAYSRALELDASWTEAAEGLLRLQQQ